MKKKFAVFDIDGTLIRWQLYHAIVNRLAANGDLSAEAYEKIRQARLAWKNREHDSSFRDYEIILVQQWLTESKKLSYDQYMTIVDEVVDEYIDQAYIYTRDLIKELKKQGYFLLTISGSPKEAIARVAKRYGFDDFIGAEFLVDENNRFSGEVITPFSDKASYLNNLVAKHGLDFAGSVGVGDTSSDIALLELVEHPIAFNPEKKLFEVARERGWPIVVERKNVVYELEPHGKAYQLKKPPKG